MTSLLSDQICDRLLHAEGLYHRLVLVVGREGTGKTSALRAVGERVNAVLVNVNLELSRRLLDLTERQRPLRVQRLLDEIVAERESDVILLDNIEILFEVALRQDPLRLLQGLSRPRKVVAAWNGCLEDHHIRYAEPGHPEYRRYPMEGFLAVSTHATD